MLFKSLDGREILLSPEDRSDAYRLDTIAHRMFSGYCNVLSLKGSPGLTELCMHTKCAYTNGIVAFANDKATYAYVLFEDKRMIDGSFHQFADGTWNIS